MTRSSLDGSPGLDDAAYRRLLGLRDELRRFLHWSEQQARSAGLTPAQHQLLLAVRGHPEPGGPTIREVADHLLSQHHSVVGLVDRAVGAGLVERHEDPHDRRVARVRLTDAGDEALAQLSNAHLAEMGRLAVALNPLWGEGLPGGSGAP
ncbi:MAG: MarR family winged helix-turn-helix transcriptional regulator [Acidimicrobiales bacterium]